MFIVPAPQTKGVYQKRVFQFLGSACLLSMYTGLMLSPARAACTLTTSQYTVNGSSTFVDNTANFSLISGSSQNATHIVHDRGTLTFKGAGVEIGVIGGARHSVSVGYPVGVGTLIVDGNLKTTAVNGTNQRALFVTGAGSSATIRGDLIAERNGGAGGTALQTTAGYSLYVDGKADLKSNVTNALRAGGVNSFQGDVVATTIAAIAAVTTSIDSDTEIIGELNVNAPHSSGLGIQVNGGYLTAEQISTVSAGGNAIESTAGTISVGGLSQAMDTRKTVVAIGPQASISSANANGVLIGGTQDQNILISGYVKGASSALFSNTVTGQKSDVEFQNGAAVTATSGVAYMDNAGDAHVLIQQGASITGSLLLGDGSDSFILDDADISSITLLDGGDDVSSLDGQVDQITFKDKIYDIAGSSIINWQQVFVDNGKLNLTTGSASEVELFHVNGSKLSAGTGIVLTENFSIDPSSLVSTNDAGVGMVSISGDLADAVTVALRDDVAGDTLFVGGNYVGMTGHIELDAALGVDSSLTDIIVIAGGTSGSANVTVNNIGTGAPTIEGIKIKDVGGSSDGEFILNGDYVFEGKDAVVAGAYAYQLYKGNRSNTETNDWYLRSEMKPKDPSPDNGGSNPRRGDGSGGADSGSETGSGGESVPPQPLYQTGAPSYEAYPQALLGLNSVATLGQRVGNRCWTGHGNRMIAQGADTPESFASPEEGGVHIEGNGVWGRIEVTNRQIEPKFSTSDTDFNQSDFKMQAGVDGLLNDTENEVLISGMFVQYIRGKTEPKSRFWDGQITTDGYGLGGTLTWYGNAGLYIDAQVNATWYSSDLRSTSANLDLTSGNDALGYALSMETGKRIDIDQSWSLTPQGQLVYSSIDFDGFADRFRTEVSLERGSSLQGRIGLSLDHETSRQEANGMRSRTHLYGIANLYSEFLDGTKVDVSGVGFASEQERVWGGLGAGGANNWDGDKYSLYGEGIMTTCLNSFGESYSLKGNVGFRVKWKLPTIEFI